jgi:hypothetical protein
MIVMATQKNKICSDCGKMVWSHPRNPSPRCRSCSKKGVLNSFYRKKHSIQFIKSISGENSPHWKGDKAKYSAIHIWVNSYKGKPKICEKCGITSEKTRIEWINKDHQYRRNLNDYIAFCCSCHLKYDLINGLRTYIPKQDSITGKFIPI